jgi:hypothetical protein
VTQSVIRLVSLCLILTTAVVSAETLCTVLCISVAQDGVQPGESAAQHDCHAPAADSTATAILGGTESCSTDHQSGVLGVVSNRIELRATTTLIDTSVGWDAPIGTLPPAPSSLSQHHGPPPGTSVPLRI